MQRGGDVVGDAGLGAKSIARSRQLALDAAADQARAEALALGRLDGRAAAFRANGAKLRERSWCSARRPHLSSRCPGADREGAVLGGVRHQFVQDEAEIDGVARRQVDARARRCTTRSSLLLR